MSTKNSGKKTRGSSGKSKSKSKSKKSPQTDKKGDSPQATWRGEVAHSATGYSYRPHQIICVGKAAKKSAIKLALRLAKERELSPVPTPEVKRSGEFWLVKSPLFDVEEHVEILAERGAQVEPNHVLFAHAGGCGCGCGGGCDGAAGNPVYASPVYASPVYASGMTGNPVYASSMTANPVYASPVYASSVRLSPVYASPVYASPVYASEYKKTGKRSHSAKPATKPKLKLPSLPARKREKVFILDSGIAPPKQLPKLLASEKSLKSAGVKNRDPHPPESQGYLNPANGHGTFVAGIIEELAPGRDPIPVKVLGPMGEGDVWEVAKAIEQLAKKVDRRTVLNLSLGGYADRNMVRLKSAIVKIHQRGGVVVASAGNDATCRRTFPACLAHVVGVGALAPDGPAPFSNHGPWVRACAPGTDLVSAFYKHYNGAMPELPLRGSGDPDEFHGWARWSGTSFAAPIVTAALLRTMALTGCTAKEAVHIVVDAPGLHQLPGLGTVVNLVTPFSDAT